jgi:hypothetical protein
VRNHADASIGHALTEESLAPDFPVADLHLQDADFRYAHGRIGEIHMPSARAERSIHCILKKPSNVGWCDHHPDGGAGHAGILHCHGIRNTGRQLLVQTEVRGDSLLRFLAPQAWSQAHSECEENERQHGIPKALHPPDL